MEKNDAITALLREALERLDEDDLYDLDDLDDLDEDPADAVPEEAVVPKQSSADAAPVDAVQAAPKRTTKGGRHDKQTMWTGEEGELLMDVVKSGAYMEKGKLQWKKLTIEHFPTRNDAAVRNHYLRIEKATKVREREDGDKKRNKCRKCGKIKLGHICMRFAGSGSGGSAAGSSAGGKLLRLRAAGLKVIASARIVKRFNHFKSVKLHTVLDSIVRGDPIDDDANLAVRGWAAQCFPHGLAPSDNYPPNGRPRALTRAVTESIDASFEAYVKSLIEGCGGESGGCGGKGGSSEGGVGGGSDDTSREKGEGEVSVPVPPPPPPAAPAAHDAGINYGVLAADIAADNMAAHIAAASSNIKGTPPPV